MNAEHVLLTHFSARYPKMPPTGLGLSNRKDDDQEGQSKEAIVALAFDHANLLIGDLWKVNYYLRAIEKCMQDTAEEEAEDEEDAEMIVIPEMEQEMEE
jgi:ribonuclease Z